MNFKNEKFNWIIKGLVWGFFMFILTNGIKYLKGEELISTDLLKSISIWFIGGIVFGFLMKNFNKNKLT